MSQRKRSSRSHTSKRNVMMVPEVQDLLEDRPRELERGSSVAKVKASKASSKAVAVKTPKEKNKEAQASVTASVTATAGSVAVATQEPVKMEDDTTRVAREPRRSAQADVASLRSADVALRGEANVAKDRQPESVADVVPESVDPLSSVPFTSSRLRRRVDKDVILNEVDNLLVLLEEQIEQTRTNKHRDVKIRTFRDLQAKAKKIRTYIKRAVKSRKHTSRGQCGFMKPAPITAKMAKFANWNPSELKSRVNVTDYLCDYVNKNGLKNPVDKRQILPDEKLATLLNYNAEEEEPLTYYYLQKKIQPLFEKKDVDKRSE